MADDLKIGKGTTFNRSKGLLIEQVFTSNTASGGNCAPTLSTGYASPAT